jgi:hypothetical protein
VIAFWMEVFRSLDSTYFPVPACYSCWSYLCPRSGPLCSCHRAHSGSHDRSFAKHQVPLSSVSTSLLHLLVTSLTTFGASQFVPSGSLKIA